MQGRSQDFFQNVPKLRNQKIESKRRKIKNYYILKTKKKRIIYLKDEELNRKNLIEKKITKIKKIEKMTK